MTRVKFAPTSDNYMFTRDYISVQIWDVRNNTNAIQTFNVTDYLEHSLVEVYENERIFDKWDLQVSPCSTMVLTGAYNSNAHVLNMQKERINATIAVHYMDRRGKTVGV